MKTTLLVLLVFCAAAAFGQAPILSNQPAPVVMVEHPQHAAFHALGQENPIVGLSVDTYTYARGERPLWEFGPVSVEPSLGDIAREFRKEKLGIKKAAKVFEKQGS